MPVPHNRLNSLQIVAQAFLPVLLLNRFFASPGPDVDHGDHAADGGSPSNVRESGRARFLLGKVRTPWGEGMVGVRAKQRRPASRLETKNKRGTSNVFAIAFRTASAASFGSLAARQYRHR